MGTRLAKRCNVVYSSFPVLPTPAFISLFLHGCEAKAGHGVGRDWERGYSSYGALVLTMVGLGVTTTLSSSLGLFLQSMARNWLSTDNSFSPEEEGYTAKKI